MRAMQKAQIMWSIFANTVPASEPRPFLQILLPLTFLTVPSSFCNLCANMSSNRGSRLICFHRRLLWQILRGTNALCFQLLTLIAAYWLRIGTIVRPYQPVFQSSSYLFLIILQKMWAENATSKRVTNYWTTIGAHCLILSSHFSTAEVLLLMAWWSVAAKTTFILKTVQPLMVRLSLACGPAFQKLNFQYTYFCSSLFLEIGYRPYKLL